MGWLKKAWSWSPIGALQGMQERTRKDISSAGKARLEAANIKLNDPNYFDTWNQQMGYFGGMASADQRRLEEQYRTATGDVGRGYDETMASMRDTFGQAKAGMAATYGQQRRDITRMQGLNARALAGFAGGSLAQMGHSAGGSLQARMAALTGLQGQLGQQAMQNQAQGLQAGLEASGQYMGMQGQMAAQEAGQYGQLGGQRMGVLAQLASQFAGLQSQAGQNYAQMGMQAGDSAYGNLMQQAILRRQIAQEPFLTRSENLMAKANNRQAMFGSLMQLGGQALSAFATAGTGTTKTEAGAAAGGATAAQGTAGQFALPSYGTLGPVSSRAGGISSRPMWTGNGWSTSFWPTS